MTALARGGNLPWNTATAMVRPTTAAMAKIRTVIHMALPLHTSYYLYVTYSVAAARLQVARAIPATPAALTPLSDADCLIRTFGSSESTVRIPAHYLIQTDTRGARIGAGLPTPAAPERRHARQSVN